MSWEDEARNWIAWARAPEHDAYWEYSPRFFELVPPAGRAVIIAGSLDSSLFSHPSERP